MKRRDFLSGLAASVALSGQALAQDYVGSVTSQLKKMGFRITREERTLLGRVRIVATRSDGRREIIINPNSGEILRDLWTPVQGSKRTSDIISDKSGGGSSSSSDDDGDDDDDDDDGDESSNSGSSGSSGSGSSGGDDDDDGGDDGGDDDSGDDGGDDGGDDSGDDGGDDDD
jgi:hypothetical protein